MPLRTQLQLWILRTRCGHSESPCWRAWSVQKGHDTKNFLRLRELNPLLDKPCLKTHDSTGPPWMEVKKGISSPDDPDNHFKCQRDFLVKEKKRSNKILNALIISKQFWERSKSDSWSVKDINLRPESKSLWILCWRLRDWKNLKISASFRDTASMWWIM